MITPQASLIRFCVGVAGLPGEAFSIPATWSLSMIPPAHASRFSKAEEEQDKKETRNEQDHDCPMLAL